MRLSTTLVLLLSLFLAPVLGAGAARAQVQGFQPGQAYRPQLRPLPPQAPSYTAPPPVAPLGAPPSAPAPAPVQDRGVLAAPAEPQQPAAPRRIRDERIRAALLVPLSGRHAALGEALLQAGTLALFDIAAGNDRFDLLPRDTGGDAEGARAAAAAAIADGADILLGPLFASEALAVSGPAAAAGVPVLTFSNDWTLARRGLLVMGFQPGDQIRRITGFALSAGYGRFGVLAPSNAYGDAVATAARETIESAGTGAQLLAEGRYDPEGSPAEALAALAAQDLDALIIGEGGQRLAGLAEAIMASPLAGRRIRLLGPGLWDNQEIQALPLLTTAWYAAPDPGQRSSFESSFTARFGRPPNRVATLAYDAVALAAVLAGRYGDERDFSPFEPERLKRRSGFAGTDGLFRIRSSGLVERSLAVLEISRSGVRVIDPAPQAFQPEARSNSGY